MSSVLFFSTAAISKEFSSTIEATELIELYTSEGCSSCPPADTWLRKLKSDPRLFKQFIPLAFHVDYWNRLGWQDRFSKKQYTNRQRQHQAAGNLSQVYTPGFVVNNQEWRQWRAGYFFTGAANSNKTGILKVDYKESLQQLDISFASALNSPGKALILNVAILGMGLSSDVKVGENRGRKLEHEFVVLAHTQQPVRLEDTTIQQWQIDAPIVPQSGQQQSALVVWISEAQSQHVIQATGGYLD